MPASLASFVARWQSSGGSERANKDSFLKELCQVLGVPEPDPKQGDPKRDAYVFERDVRMQQPDGAPTTKFIDLYKEGCFVLEAKQSAARGAEKAGTARRDTRGWANAMEAARKQAIDYALHLDPPPPFLVVCDIGTCFDLYACFDGSARYLPFPHPDAKRVAFEKLGEKLDLLRTIWTDPHRLDPSRQAKKVSEEVAASLAKLARDLEESGHPAEQVADFLMRCLFTMFAEDVGLLEEKLFTTALERYWIPSPASFPLAVENLWRAMNDGGVFGVQGKLLRFNGGLFASAAALPLTRGQLEGLLDAAKHDWSQVDPAIFGTLLERALDAKDRHRLGAHYTPRAYVERLVRPTVEEPLRTEWNDVRAEALLLLEKGKDADAKKALHAFHERLVRVRVLDPACGTGNFLYVTLDLLKQLEAEVLAELRELGETQQLLGSARVSPANLLGIEVNARAKAIAELVLWIGHLQWHYRTHGRVQPPPEPVLLDLKNIEHRDAVLAWDRIELVRDETGKPVTRWDGVTTKEHPVTREQVPDERAQVPVERYVNPRKAEWPKADFVVGNPPFLGKLKLLDALGDAYAEALRTAHEGDVPDSADYVMYWWARAATLVRSKAVRRFGFVTTNSVVQPFNRRVVAAAMIAGVQLVYALPDHPWVDGGAAVRVAMTVGAAGGEQQVVRAVATVRGDAVVVEEKPVAALHADLTCGADIGALVRLEGNLGLSHVGVGLHGAGFALGAQQARDLRRAATAAGIDGVDDRIRPTLNGRDIAQTPRDGVAFVDLYGLDLEQAKRLGPIYQWLLDRVKPERDGNRRESRRRNWWLFGENAPNMRRAVADLERYVGTTLSSRHRVFQFIDRRVLPDQTIVVVASGDGCVLGVLSSRVHVTWAAATGARLGVGNDLRYLKATCFDAFPFPACADSPAARIRDLGEQLDAHRKRQQAAHPGLTITAMYNVLEKLRRGDERLTDKELVIHDQAQTSLLRQIHDDLDAEVLDAYGWPRDLTDEQILERLVALNAERAEEERKGLVRWLRPDFQNPGGARPATQETLATGDEGASDDDAGAAPAAPAAARPWPKKLGERIAGVRELFAGSKRLWSTAEVASAFKGAKKPDVEDLLEGLAGIGAVVATGEAKGRRWGAARG